MGGGFTTWTARSVSAVLKEQGVILASGLDSAEAEARLEAHGRNAIGNGQVHAWQIFFRQFKSSFVFLLIAAGAIALALGEYLDGWIIFAFVFLNALISFYQEYRSEQTVKLLKRFIARRAKVRRDGKEVEVDQNQIVPGDIVIVEAGDMIPADLRLVRAENLIVNETVLTGESVAVAKHADALAIEASEIYQAQNIGFSGTTIVCGRAEGVVIATGKKSVMGNVARLTTETERVSIFSQEINAFSGFVLKVILLTLVLIVVGNVLTEGGQTNIGDLLIFAIALAVSVVPEALPVVTTFSLSHGALRLAKHKVVVKRLSAIEDLGSIEVLCTDKTGTLTENELSVHAVAGPHSQKAVLYATMASLTKSGKISADPFDVALRKASKLSDGTLTVKGDIPFDPARRRNSVLVKHNNASGLIVRGAPELIMAATKQISEKEHEELTRWAAEQGRKGCRVLAVGKKVWPGKSTYELKDEEHGLELIGLVAFIDPIKPSAKAAINKAKRLGVTIKILTGDSREVAGAVAYEVGLIERPEDVMSGEEFEALSPSKRHQAVDNVHVFARVSPEQKFEIIQLLEEKKQVGFLGEGINDAPALKVANVAIVVESAADIAREAADIILLKRSLSVVVDGIIEGRIVFANTLKYIKATLASNFGNFYAVAVATLFIDYLPMLPLQILLLNLLTDFPMISIAADRTDPDELARPETYHMKDIALFMILIGVVSTVFDFIFFAVFQPYGQSTLQTAWFLGSVFTELAFLFSIRSKLPFYRANRPATILIVLSLAAAALAILLPFTTFGARVFHLITPPPAMLLTIFLIVAAYFVTTETAKLFYYRLGQNKKS